MKNTSIAELGVAVIERTPRLPDSRLAAVAYGFFSFVHYHVVVNRTLKGIFFFTSANMRHHEGREPFSRLLRGIANAMRTHTR